MISLKQTLTIFLYGIVMSYPLLGKPYTIVMSSGEAISELEFVSIEESTLNMFSYSIVLGPQGSRMEGKSLLSFPVDSIIRVENLKHGTFLDQKIIHTDINLIRGLAMGTISGYIGMFAGAGIGYLFGTIFMPNDELIAPVFGGGGVGLVVSTTAGIIYFSKHKIGRPPKHYDLSSLSLEDKQAQLKLIFSGK